MEAIKEEIPDVLSDCHVAKRQKLDKEKSRHLSDFHKALDMMGMGENLDNKAHSGSVPETAKDSTSRIYSQKAEERKKPPKAIADPQPDDILQEKFVDEDADTTNVAGTSADDQEDSIAGDEDDGKVGTSNQGASNAAEEERLKMHDFQIVQQSAGCTVSPNVIIAISGIAKVFTGEIMEEALEIRDRMKEAKDAVKPKHIREALRRLTEKGGLSSTIITKRKSYCS